MESFLRFLAALGFIGPDFPDHGTLLDLLEESRCYGPVAKEIIALTADPLREFGQPGIAANGTGGRKQKNR